MRQSLAAMTAALLFLPLWLAGIIVARADGTNTTPQTATVVSGAEPEITVSGASASELFWRWVPPRSERYVFGFNAPAPGQFTQIDDFYGASFWSIGPGTTLGVRLDSSADAVFRTVAGEEVILRLLARTIRSVTARISLLPGQEAGLGPEGAPVLPSVTGRLTTVAAFARVPEPTGFPWPDYLYVPTNNWIVDYGWFRWSPPADGLYALSLSPTQEPVVDEPMEDYYWPKVLVFGSPTSESEAIVSVETTSPASSAGPGATRFFAQADQVYFVAVITMAASRRAAYDLRATALEEIENVRENAALPIPSAVAFSQHVAPGSPRRVTPSSPYDERWGSPDTRFFSWMAPRDGMATFGSAGGEVWLLVDVGGRVLPLYDFRQPVVLRTGQRVTIAVRPERWEPITFHLDLGPMIPPGNDDRGGAITLSSTVPAISDPVALGAAGREPDEPAHVPPVRGIAGQVVVPAEGRGAAHHSAWWSWKASYTGLLQLYADGTGFGRAQTALYETPAATHLEPVPREPAALHVGGALYSVTVGRRYLIAADDELGTSGATQVELYQAVERHDIRNDDFANRTVLVEESPGGRFTAWRTTVWDYQNHAYSTPTLEPGEPVHSGLPGATSSTWWSFRPPKPGLYRASVDASEEPGVRRGPRLALYRPATTVSGLAPWPDIRQYQHGDLLFEASSECAIAVVTDDRWPDGAGPVVRPASAYDQWQTEVFAGSHLNPSPEAIPLADGFTNLEKFAFGLDPTRSAFAAANLEARSRQPQVKVEGQVVEMSLRLDPQATGNHGVYAVLQERTNDQTLGLEWTAVSGFAPGVSYLPYEGPDFRFGARIDLTQFGKPSAIFRFALTLSD